ncbi:MAG: peptidoglycan recognition family protein [Planctomycetota bacterium]|nr:peptidoglycan recognition family protein [Planctomycetota bacterium]
MTSLRAAVVPVLLLVACRSGGERPDALDPAAARDGDEIVVCGKLFDVGTTVVPWFEAPYYSAYAPHPRFADEGPSGLRYRPGREVADPGLQRRVDGRGFRLDELREVVDLFVIHYDVCGTSRRCFEVLQDVRKLSVHFLLDVDGTIYQTLDLSEQAWHAAQANPRSIGIELAQIGAYPVGGENPFDAWYAVDEAGPRLTIPESLGADGVRTPDFVGRPARPGLHLGSIQGVEYAQHDFTPEQYDALVALTAALCEIFPRIAPDAPRDAAGRVRTDALDDGDLAAFQGILGHQHVTERKQDPGPAFDWEGYLSAVRARL